MNKIAIAVLFSLFVLPNTTSATELDRTAPAGISNPAWHFGLEESMPDLLPEIPLLNLPSLSDNNQTRKAKPIESTGSHLHNWIYPSRQPDTVLDKQPISR